MTQSDKKEVTAIEIQKKNRRRRSVYLDGEYAFGIHQDVLLESGFGIGDFLTEHEITAVRVAEQTKGAKDKALRLLSVRGRSEHEMRKRLIEANIDNTVIENVIENLLRIGLLNDKEFALSFARSQVATKPCGELLLRQELRKKGISDELINCAVEEAYKEKSQTDLAHFLAIKKKRQFQSLEEIKAKKRTSDYLLRRGFSWDIVSTILDNWQNLNI